MSRAATVHPKRMTRKIINCLTNLGSISPPRCLLTTGWIAFFRKIVYADGYFQLELL
jgi:hypothetical protein